MKTVVKTLKMGLMVFALVLTSCSKDGELGPIGPAGTQGEQGIQGEQGVAGQDGEALGVPGPAGSDGADGTNGTDGTDGAIGPQGEQGSVGAAGEDGAQGDQGDQGETGTANVIYSDWIERDLPGPAASSNSQLLVTLGAADDDIQDTDVVLVYGRRPVNALFFEVSQLPFILTTQDEYYGFVLGEGLTFSTIRVETRSTDGGNNLFTYFDDFRYVIIPGGISSSGKAPSKDYSKMTYEEIVALFNIPE